MQPKGWKKLWFWVLLAASSGTNWFCIKFNAAWAANSNLGSSEKATIPSMVVAQATHQPCQQRKPKAINSELPQLWLLELVNTDNAESDEVSVAKAVALRTEDIFENTVIYGRDDAKNISVETCESIELSSSLPAYSASELANLHSQAAPNQTPPTPATPESSTAETKNNLTQQLNEPPQLEVQPSDIPEPSSTQIEQRLETNEIDTEERLQKLLQLLEEKKQASLESNGDDELGTLKLREVPLPLEQQELPPLQQPVIPSKPIGYLLGRVGYFQTSNIFSSAVDPINDGLILSGLTLASAPVPLGSNTYLNGSIDGNVIRYIDQSKYNYNQLRFNLSIYQQLTQRMFGEIGWTNQQLFYTKDGDFFNAGDRFLNENSLRLSLGRRDSLTRKLMLDSFYEFRVSLTNPPEDRNRITNFLWLSLNYYLQRSLQVGIDYQFGLSNFTERDREDQYHRLYAHLNYRASTYSNISLQGGVSLGDSTDRSIDFDGWFFSLNYSLELGKF